MATIVAQVAPGSRLVATSSFAGGMSSEVILVEVEGRDGTRERFVVRRPRGERGAISMDVEFRLLESLWVRGLPVPEPLSIDESCTISDRPYMVLGYIEGETRFETQPDGGVDVARRWADLLAAVHQVDGTLPEFDALPRRLDRVAGVLEQPRPDLEDSIRDQHILEVLRTHWPPPSTPDALLHGDLWLGNVLWSGPDVVALIDWEAAGVGDPLADVSIARLECAWSFGRDAVAALTERYVERTGVDCTPLPLWDLMAARRPALDISEWAADWANYGAVMTTARMRAVYRWFVDDALAALGEAD